MGFRTIEKKNRLYSFLLKYVVKVAHNKLFYRRLHVLNTENIPQKGHLIFTPNHQNALMDALALLCNIERQLVFVARSDIFRKKFVASILYFLKILPIFRIRDGYSEVKKNEAIFKKTIDVIKGGNGLVILPEGNHEGKRRLRPLKKGFARIAFQTEEAFDFSLDIKIVPVGLHYSNYTDPRSDLIINFGPPLHLSAYYDLYKESPAKAINRITSELADHIRPLMLHIDNLQEYDFYDAFRVMFYNQFYDESKVNTHNYLNQLEAEQKIVSFMDKLSEKKPGKYKQLKTDFEAFTKMLTEKDLAHTAVDSPSSVLTSTVKVLKYLLLLPVYLFGLIVNGIPLLVVRHFVKKIKDVQFKSSFNFVLSLGVFLFYYFILIACSFFIPLPPWILILLLTAIPLSRYITMDYRKDTGTEIKQIRTIYWLKKHPQPAEKMFSQKEKILKIINSEKNI